MGPARPLIAPAGRLCLPTMNTWRDLFAIIRENPLYVYIAVAIALAFILVVSAVLVTL